VVDLERDVGTAAVGAATPVDGEHAGPQSPVRPSAWTPAVTLAVGALGEDAAAKAGLLHNQPSSFAGSG
jgi:hypothetical protein